MAAATFEVVSLNCWGVPLVAKHRSKRIEAIAERLLGTLPDLVGLQEIWIKSDYQLLCDRLSSAAYPYKYYFRSGVIGSGLAVFSRHPIVEVAYKRFSVNGKPHHLMHGDWLGGKGVGLCRIQLPEGGGALVDFYITHLHACYTTIPEKDEYMAHRIAQCWELMQFIRHSSRNSVIICGDFNFDPSTLPYSLLTAPAESIGGGGFRDSFAETVQTPAMHQRMEMAVRAELLLPEDWKPRIHSTLRPNDELRERIYADAVRGATSHAHSNSFFVHDDMNDFERIDYIMYQPTTGLQCLHSRLTFLSLLPDIKCSYSDHYGMMAQFQITTVSSDKPAEKAEGREFAAIGSDIKNQVGAASAAVDSQISIDAPKSKLYLDVCEADLLPAMICVLTQGVKNARYRISLYTVQSFLYGLLWGAWNALLLAMGIYTAVQSATNSQLPAVSGGGMAALLLIAILIYALTWLLCFVSVMCRFVLPEELAALERIRSEIVLWVGGHSKTPPVLNLLIVDRLLRLAGIVGDSSAVCSPTISPTGDAPFPKPGAGLNSGNNSEYTAIPLTLIPSPSDESSSSSSTAAMAKQDEMTAAIKTIPRLATRPKRTWSHPILGSLSMTRVGVADIQATGSGGGVNLSNINTSGRHRRNLSNMANPGPSEQQSGDFLAISTLQAAFGGRSSDHSAAVSVVPRLPTSAFSPRSPLLEADEEQQEEKHGND